MDPLNILRFCCTNGLCANLSYQGGNLGTRMVFPYSMKAAKNGNMILHAWCIPDNRIEKYVWDLVTKVDPLPILAEEQGHAPNDDWLFNYPKAPSLYSSNMLIHFTNKDEGGTALTWHSATPEQRTEAIKQFLSKM